MNAAEISSAIAKALGGPLALDVATLAALFSLEDAGAWAEIKAAAREIKSRLGKSDTLLRGLIETSNICQKDCLYCGIRRSNAAVGRYRLDERTIAACVEEAVRRGYPAVAFQSGELESDENTAFFERVLSSLPSGLEVTLSLGEQSEDVYRRWKDAAGERTIRYLLRIESSDRNVFAAIHPGGYSFDRRLGCIRALKRLGYVTGSGVMIGLPGQNMEMLARDLVFFGEERLDMVGMGPFIPAPNTPMGDAVPAFTEARRVEMTLRMIALARLYLHSVNIVSATALEALGGVEARQAGLDAGANVVMPVLTPAECRCRYSLYPAGRQTEVTIGEL